MIQWAMNKRDLLDTLDPLKVSRKTVRFQSISAAWATCPYLFYMGNIGKIVKLLYILPMCFV